MSRKKRINQKSIHKFTKLLEDTQIRLLSEDRIFNINSESEFNELALEIFHFQYLNNPVYNEWVDLLKVNVNNVKLLSQIPCLPIEFFKDKKVISSPVHEKTIIFTSSSTTSQIPAKHYVNEPGIYEKSFRKTFELFYGRVKDICILALLPNYLQRTGSSLVYMCDKLMKDSDHSMNGFFLDNISELISKIELLKKTNQKTLLIGVSYALMDLAEKNIRLNENFIVMETGGMKGTRKELLKQELHLILKNGFGIDNIHSEYGMTELLSQAYSNGNGTFSSPPWLRFQIRDVTDPLSLIPEGKTGGINVIDLANLHSCSFIATRDLGKLDKDNKLELMGRYDNSDVRGCNLMLGL